MARRRRANWRRIKRHRSYTVDELARTLDVSKGTVRLWLKKGLPSITDRRPALLLGDDVISFLKTQGRPKQTCAPGEMFCLKCQAPRKPAFDMVEVASATPSSVNLRGFCPECETLMHQRVSQRKLDAFGQKTDAQPPQAPTRINDTSNPCVNDDLAKESRAHA